MDGKNRELTPEEEAAELAKPGSHPEWETDLPTDLQKAIQDYLDGIRNQVTLLGLPVGRAVRLHQRQPVGLGDL